MSTPEEIWTTRLHAAVDDHPGALAFDVPSYVAAGRKRARRNRAVAVLATIAAVVSVAGGAALATGGTRTEPPQPAAPTVPTQGPTPTPTGSPSTDADWPLEQIRAKGVVEVEDVTASGITVRLYAVCDGPEAVCGPNVDGPIRSEHSHFAIEVAQDGQSALFSIDGDSPYSLTPVGEDAVLVFQEPPERADLTAASYRLLRADHTEHQLRSLIDDPVPAVPRPGAVTVNFGPVGSETTTHPFVLDEGVGTLRPMALARSAGDRDRVLRDLGAWWPETGLSWGPNPDEFLWFVYHDCTVHWGTGEFYGDGGSYREHELDCGEGFDGAFGEDDFTYLRDNMFPAGWLQPGRMAAIENSDGRLFLHVSLDQGESWQRVPVNDEAAVPDTLRQLG